MNPRFRNVDLEIVAPAEPKRMLSELDESIVLIFSGSVEDGHFAVIESAREFSSPEDAINEFKSLLTGLSSEAFSEWSGAIKREFNFGFDCRSDIDRQEVHIPSSTVATLFELDASVGFTLYSTE